VRHPAGQARGQALPQSGRDIQVAGTRAGGELNNK
jgi:hypothetical protein